MRLLANLSPQKKKTTISKPTLIDSPEWKVCQFLKGKWLFRFAPRFLAVIFATETWQNWHWAKVPVTLVTVVVKLNLLVIMYVRGCFQDVLRKLRFKTLLMITCKWALLFDRIEVKMPISLKRMLEECNKIILLRGKKFPLSLALWS